MRAKLLEKAIEESEIRDGIRESLPKETREGINFLFSQIDKIWWATVAPELHALYASLIVGFIVFFAYHEILRINTNVFLEIALLAIFLILFFKSSIKFVDAIFYRRKSDLLFSGIIALLNQKAELRETLWLIRAKSHPRDRHIATLVMQKMLKEEKS